MQSVLLIHRSLELMKLSFVSCLLLLLLPSGLWATDLFDPGEDSSLDFLYINANAGEAAGGHAALRLGDAVFHYQFFPDETFLLVRDSWSSFRFLYNDLHNRSISIATLPLDNAVQSKIKNHLTELLMTQQEFFNALDQAQTKKETFLRLLDGEFTFAVKGLGFFKTSVKGGENSYLRKVIADGLGEDFLVSNMGAAEDSVQKIVERINSGGEVSSQQLVEALSLQSALRVLAGDSVLDKQNLIPAMGWEQHLSAEEKDGLRQFGDYLEDSIIGLLLSKRPDRGETLLLQTARYLAVSQSIATSILVTLDPFFETVRTVELDDADLEEGKLDYLQKDLQRQANRYRELFLQIKGHPEIACSLLETSRARTWELFRVSKSHRQVRMLVRPVLPTKAADVIVDNLHPDADRLRAAVKQLDTTIADLYNKRDIGYGYNLIARNCATELIRSLNSSFPNLESGGNSLGGWLAADDGLVFVPFLFYNEATATYAVAEEQLLLARRLRNLEKLYREENDLWVWLRESNTFSSTLYEPRTKDTPFLFFTDDSFLLRPVLGAFNLGYATLHGVAAVFTAPFDGGEGLSQAGRGMFYSLPELLFGNIRKGSYPLGKDMARP